jgi:hypothetical protein
LGKDGEGKRRDFAAVFVVVVVVVVVVVEGDLVRDSSVAGRASGTGRIL